jgi:cytochrome c551/c552
MRTTLRLVAAAACVVALAACSDGGVAGPGGAPAGESSTIPADMAVKFAQCMRENGVDVADPRPGQPLIIKGDRNDTAKIRAAQEACKEFAPPQEGGGPQAGDDLDRQAKLAECLRRHGVDVADPQPGQPLRVEGRRENEAETQRAMQECQREVGAPPPSRIG